MADPCYTTLLDGGELARRAEGALASLERCELCPRCCAVDRTADQTGECNTGRDARLCSAGPHFGEESPLVGTRGSGTLFFGGCNLNCDFCQNSEISQAVTGREADARDLADAMLGIQAMGCHNLNLVTPTHVTAQVLEALVIAAGRGLRLPVVYNCGGYESVDTLRWLDGVVDVYMPDLKFLDPEVAGRYCDAPDYPDVARAAIAEMHRQVGDLVVDPETGVAQRGLLVRHLVLPGGRASSTEAMRFLAEEVSTDTYVNVMGQYRPCHRIRPGDPLWDRPTAEEIREARRQAHRAGLHRLDDARDRLRLIIP